MAAKRYRSPGYRTFHRAASYTEGRSMKRSRDERAIKRKSEQAGVEAEVLGWLMARPVRDGDTTVAIAQLSRERGQDPSEVLVWYQRAAELGEESSWGWISDLAEAAGQLPKAIAWAEPMALASNARACELMERLYLEAGDGENAAAWCPRNKEAGLKAYPH